jgi:hypothetical protein
MAGGAIDTGANYGMGYDFRPDGYEEPVQEAPAQDVQVAEAPTGPRFPSIPAAQQGVINTTPAQAAPPQPEVNEDEDLPKWDADWRKASGVIRQHYGNYKELMAGAPTLQELVAQDPRMTRLSEAQRIADEAFKRGQVDQKTYNNKMMPELRRMEAQIHADAKMKATELQKQIAAQHREAIQSAEAKEGGSAFTERAADIEQRTKVHLDELAAKANTADPQEKAKYEGSSLVAAPKVLGEAYMPIAARLSLKNNLLGKDTVLIMNSLTTPVFGQPGFNGYKGRAAANYRVVGVDAADNYMVQLPGERGVVRLSQADLRAIEKARMAGYNIWKDWQTKRAAAAAEPGVLSRAVDWTKRQFD